MQLATSTWDNNVVSSDQYRPDISDKLRFMKQQIFLLKEELMKTQETCSGVPVNVPEINGGVQNELFQERPICLFDMFE